MQRFDCIVVGSGIAGASAAYEIAGDRRVLLVEREMQPGYHATGRSAALFAETYGSAPVRALTAASKAFLTAPPGGFAATPLMTPRPILLIGRDDQRDRLQAAYAENAPFGTVERLTGAQARALVPVLDPGVITGGVLEPRAQDIDVDAVHRGYLRGFGRRGGKLALGAEVLALRHRGDLWTVATSAGPFQAPIVVNAAGAWADAVARLAGIRPIGLVPKRRSAFIFSGDTGAGTEGWPAVIDIDETFYFKPEAGLLLGSPANEDPVAAQDVQPEELDIALAVDRIEAATTLKVARIGRRWAGLRSFVADRIPVNGFDGRAPGFYWLAGQGGYGIQTAPAMARLCAALVRGEPVPDDLARHGIEPAALSPARLGREAVA
ncbi:NAD(P)/FAD-dependent oxidoreductase [Microvirga pudoricolor]|uniref:NAD(P)/FAD-dependent oxidoreductase n=1 Tax=Microvirga pudoricolor TaxID=2778729 RepID=UPI001951A899|nr:FAD-dependent oxidoreductase [Microvirga pudoricolor]MBM6593626.1 FAD-binding oxidoreductase [Microvirga pudoricolor]